MNLFLLGATGRTGRLVAERALSRSHTVTAIVRDRTALGWQPRLNIVVADPLRADLLARDLADHDAVISCLGQKSRGDALLLQKAASAALDAMAHTGTRRFLVVSQSLLFPSRNPIIFLLRLILARHVVDSIAMEQLVRASDVDWVIVRPPRLLEGGASRGYHIKVGARPKGSWSMQRSDLATFLVDTAETWEHKRAIIGIGSN